MKQMPKLPTRIANVVFIGPPRSGKSSVLRSVLGERQPDVSCSTAIVESSMAAYAEGMIRKYFCVKDAEKELRNIGSKKCDRMDESTLTLACLLGGFWQKQTTLSPSEDYTYHGPMESGTEAAERQDDGSNKPERKISRNKPHRNVEVAPSTPAVLGDSIVHEVSGGPKTGSIANPHFSTEVNDVVGVIGQDQSVRDECRRRIKKMIGDVEEIAKFVEKSIIVHIFDTGGQPEFLELLPYLLSTTGAIYVICFKDCEPLNERYIVKYQSQLHEDPATFQVLSQATTEETIFQCIFSAEQLGASSFTPKTKAMFVATHVDQCFETQFRNRRRIMKRLKEMDLLQERCADIIMDEKYFEVCTERDAQNLLLELKPSADNKLSDLVPDLEQRFPWLKWNEDKFVADENSKHEDQHILKILNHYKDDKIREFAGVTKVNKALCEMIDTTAKQNIELRDFLIYYALAFKTTKKILPPIITLTQCLEVAKEMNCVSPGSTDSEVKELKQALHRLDKHFGLIKYAGNLNRMLDKLDVTDYFIICDPQELYRVVASMVYQCYQASSGKKLRRKGVLDLCFIKEAFESTLRKLKEDSDTEGKSLGMLTTFLQYHHILRETSDDLFFLPSALRPYPVEIIPIGEDTVIAPVFLVPKGYIQMGIISALLVKGEEWESNKIVWKLDNEVPQFRNKVKFYVSNYCVSILLVARSTCIEVRVEKVIKEVRSTLFKNIIESLKCILDEIIDQKVTLKVKLYCYEKHTDDESKGCFVNDRPPSDRIDNTLFCEKCKRCVDIPSCSVWFSEVSHKLYMRTMHILKVPSDGCA